MKLLIYTDYINTVLSET